MGQTVVQLSGRKSGARHPHCKPEGGRHVSCLGIPDITNARENKRRVAGLIAESMQRPENMA